MKKTIAKNKLSILALSFFSACLISSLIGITTSASLFLSLEIGFIAFFFFNVVFIYNDRFNVFTFLLLNLFLGILDIIFVALNIRKVDIYYSMHIYEKALLIVIIWLICFTLGFCISKKTKGIKTFPKAKEKLFYKQNIKILLVIYGVIYLFCVYKIISTIMVLGLDTAIINSNVFRYDNQGYIAVLLTFSVIIPLCFYELGRKKLSFCSLILMIGILMLTGRRGMILNTLVIPMVVYYNYRIKPINNKILFLLGIFCVFIILFLGGIRNQSSDVNTSNKFVETLANLTVAAQYGENLPDTINVLETKKISFQGNKYIFNGFAGIIPRKLWENKPELVEHSMIVSKLVYNNDIYGKPIATFGFAYLCYGYIGVVICGAISGFLSCKLYNFMKNNKNFISIFLYSIILTYLIDFNKPESVTKMITIVIIVFVTVLVSSILTNRKRCHDE